MDNNLSLKCKERMTRYLTTEWQDMRVTKLHVGCQILELMIDLMVTKAMSKIHKMKKATNIRI